MGHTRSLSILLFAVLYVNAAPSSPEPSSPSSPVLNHIVLSNAHYGDLREMIEHFDRKLDDVLCKTEKHLLEVKSDIKEKLNAHSDSRAKELRNILDDKLEILGLKLQQKLTQVTNKPLSLESEINGNSSRGNNILIFSGALNAICDAAGNPQAILSSLISHRVKRAVSAVTKVMELPEDACSGAEFEVSYPGDDTELLEPRVTFTNPDVCEGGWEVFLRRQDGSVNFTRPWLVYEQGFGDHKGEFWLGNRRLHQLTTARAHKMRVELTDFGGLVKTADYAQFLVGPSSDGYRLRVSGFQSGSSAGDSMALHSGQMFSTYDKDNDPHDSNCASTYKGGWWFSGCHHSNPTGLYLLPPKEKSDTKGINWFHAFQDRRSFKSVTMKIRPIA